jgi:hypothetical protein
VSANQFSAGTGELIAHTSDQFANASLANFLAAPNHLSACLRESGGALLRTRFVISAGRLYRMTFKPARSKLVLSIDPDDKSESDWQSMGE